MITKWVCANTGKTSFFEENCLFGVYTITIINFFLIIQSKNKTVKCATLAPPLEARLAGTWVASVMPHIYCSPTVIEMTK